MLRRLPALFSGLATLTVLASNAQASEPRAHDGFYFSAAGGLGYLASSVSVKPRPPGNPDIGASGMGFAGMLLLGGTPAPGLVIGGGMMGGHFSKPSVKYGDAESDADDPFVLSLTGAFVDYYFDPGAGLHALAMLGFVALDPARGGDDYSTGGGLALGLGHDWWVADEWSLGLMGRVQILATSLEKDGVTSKYTTFVPALTFNVVYH